MSLLLVLTTIPSDAVGQTASSAGSPEEFATLSPEELDGLVAPIALYPDALVAQVLGAATFPYEIVDAVVWLKQNATLTGESLMKAVDQQSWDPAVKALTQFSSVLDNLAKNLAWTSALGEASATQQQDVMAAVQRMRAKAYAAGNLKSSAEIKVVQESPQTIIIQPANPQIVYVPTYSSTVVYRRSVYVGNSYWRGGYYGGARPGYPAYRPGYPAYRPGYPGGPGTRPPYQNRPPATTLPAAARPGNLPNRPNVNPGTRPGTGTSTLPANRPNINPGTRPGLGTPATRPSTNELRGYQRPQTPNANAKPASRPNAFSGSAGDRAQSVRGNQSLGRGNSKGGASRR